MLKRLLTTAILLLSFAAALLAQEATHFAGTVNAVQGDHVSIKQQDGKSVLIMLDKTTKYVADSKPAAKADLKVGSAVAVDAKMDPKMRMLMATEVRIGEPAPSK